MLSTRCVFLTTMATTVCANHQLTFWNRSFLLHRRQAMKRWLHGHFFSPLIAWQFFCFISCFFSCCLWNEGEVSKQKGKLLDSISFWSVQRAPYPLCVWRLNCPLHAPRSKAQEKERRRERKAKEMSAIKRYKSKHSLLASVQHLTNELTSCPRPDSNGSWSTNQTAMLSTW